MVASKQLEIPVYRGVYWQRSRDSVHLHKFFGDPNFHLCVKMLSQLQNAWVPTCLEFSAQEKTEVVSGRKKDKTAAKKCGKTICEDLVW